MTDHRNGKKNTCGKQKKMSNTKCAMHGVFCNIDKWHGNYSTSTHDTYEPYQKEHDEKKHTSSWQSCLYFNGKLCTLGMVIYT